MRRSDNDSRVGRANTEVLAACLDKFGWSKQRQLLLALPSDTVAGPLELKSLGRNYRLLDDMPRGPDLNQRVSGTRTDRGGDHRSLANDQWTDPNLRHKDIFATGMGL